MLNINVNQVNPEYTFCVVRTLLRGRLGSLHTLLPLSHRQAVGDVNSDGFSDLILGTGKGAELWINNGAYVTQNDQGWFTDLAQERL